MSNIEKKQAKDFSSLFKEIKADVISYVDHRVAHYRLDFLERISKSSSLLALGLIIVFLVFSAFAFALIGAAFFIGEQLGSTAQGFGVVALFWLVLLSLTLLFRNPIKRFFLNRTVRILYKIEKEEDDDDDDEK